MRGGQDMSNILNIGSDPTFWIAFLKGAILCALLLVIGLKAYKLGKLTPKRKKWKQTFRTLIILTVITIVYVFAAYVAFGPGKPTALVDVEDVGSTKLMETKPTEKSVEEIRKEAYERKPEQLKRQDDPSFTKEKEEGDKQVDAILKRAEERQKGDQQ